MLAGHAVAAAFARRWAARAGTHNGGRAAPGPEHVMLCCDVIGGKIWRQTTERTKRKQTTVRTRTKRTTVRTLKKKRESKRKRRKKKT